PLEANALKLPVTIAQLDEEGGEAGAPRRRVRQARQGEGDVGVDRRGEPLAAEEPPAAAFAAVRVGPTIVGRRDRGGAAADVGAAAALGHPLAGGPEALDVAGEQA